MKKLQLSKTTIKTLQLKTNIKTGATDTYSQLCNSGIIACRPVPTSDCLES